MIKTVTVYNKELFYFHDKITGLYVPGLFPSRKQLESKIQKVKEFAPTVQIYYDEGIFEVLSKNRESIIQMTPNDVEPSNLKLYLNCDWKVQDKMLYLRIDQSKIGDLIKQLTVKYKLDIWGYESGLLLIELWRLERE